MPPKARSVEFLLAVVHNNNSIPVVDAYAYSPLSPLLSSIPLCALFSPRSWECAEQCAISTVLYEEQSTGTCSWMMHSNSPFDLIICHIIVLIFSWRSRAHRADSVLLCSEYSAHYDSNCVAFRRIALKRSVVEDSSDIYPWTFWFTYIIFVAIIIAISTQIIFLNKSLAAYNVNLVRLALPFSSILSPLLFFARFPLFSSPNSAFEHIFASFVALTVITCRFTERPTSDRLPLHMSCCRFRFLSFTGVPNPVRRIHFALDTRHRHTVRRLEWPRLSEHRRHRHGLPGHHRRHVLLALSSLSVKLYFHLKLYKYLKLYCMVYFVLEEKKRRLIEK